MNALAWEAEHLPDGRVIRVRRAKPSAAAVVQFFEYANFRLLDPILVPTDRLLERWAVSQGSDDYYLRWQDGAPRSRPPPLDDVMSTIVDQIVMHSPVQTRKFTCRWYLRPNEPPTVLARDLGLHPDSLDMRWRSTLWALRREFIVHGIDV